MSSPNHKLRLAGALAALATLALAVSCRGFFVKPTLTSLAVAPATPNIQTGTSNNTVQMSAVGTFNDGSVSGASVSWKLDSSATAAATISSSGLVTAVALGSGQITATSLQNPSISGATTLTVTVGCIQSIAVSPTSPSIPNPGTQPFTAMANTCNGSFNITSVATWVSSNTNVATIDSSGLATAVNAGTTNITASSGNITSSPVDVLTVQ